MDLNLIRFILRYEVLRRKGFGLEQSFTMSQFVYFCIYACYFKCISMSTLTSMATCSALWIPRWCTRTGIFPTSWRRAHHRNFQICVKYLHSQARKIKNVFIFKKWTSRYFLAGDATVAVKCCDCHFR